MMMMMMMMMVNVPFDTDVPEKLIDALDVSSSELWKQEGVQGRGLD